MATSALAQRGDKAAAADLVKLLDSPKEEVRELAVKAQVEDVKRQVKKRWPIVVGGFIFLLSTQQTQKQLQAQPVPGSAAAPAPRA